MLVPRAAKTGLAVMGGGTIAEAFSRDKPRRKAPYKQSHCTITMQFLTPLARCANKQLIILRFFIKKTGTSPAISLTARPEGSVRPGGGAHEKNRSHHQTIQAR